MSQIEPKNNNHCQDESAMENPGICENCVKGERLDGTAQGVLINTAPLPCYFASHTGETIGPDNQKSNNALLIFPDVFGFDIPNPKLLADNFAKLCGVDVWAIDIFNGKPPCDEQDLAPYYPPEPGQAANISLGMKAKKYLLWAKYVPRLIKHRPGVQDPAIIETIQHLRKEYKYEKFGAVGYCWGGAITIRLAAQPGILDTAIPVHPGGMYKDAMPKAIVPIAYLLAEEDEPWDDKLEADLQAAWKSRSDAPKHMFKHYPGTTHGFGCRPALSLPRINAAWKELNDDIANWLKETL